MTPNKEGLQWFLTILNTIQNIFDALGKVGDKVPKNGSRDCLDFWACRWKTNAFLTAAHATDVENRF